MNGHAIREAARAVAMVVHDGQCRKGAGEPYFNHVERVADAVWGWRAKAIAYLHDTIEDAKDPVQMEKALRQIFPDDIVNDVMLLSRLPQRDGIYVPAPDGSKVSYDDFISAILRGPQDVIGVKLADVNDNLKDIEDIPGARSLRFRYLSAKIRLEEAFHEQSSPRT